VKGKPAFTPEVIEEAWERAKEAPVALIDCREEIPCNPCEDACAKGAITVGPNICAPPMFDPGKCNGCGKCALLCPGMAIILLDRSGGVGAVRVSVPYEMRETLTAGEEAWAVDNEGKALGRGKIIKVSGKDEVGGTRLVTLEVPQDWALKVKGVSGRKLLIEVPEEVEEAPRQQDFLLCRCEEVRVSSVREAVGLRFRSLGALRRYSRVGLGICQGRFCQSMLRDKLVGESMMEHAAAGIFKVRPPVRPVSLSRLGGENG